MAAKLYKSPEVKRLLRQLKQAAPDLLFTARNRALHNERRKQTGIPLPWETLRTKNPTLQDAPSSSVQMVPFRPSQQIPRDQKGQQIPEKVRSGFDAGLSDSRSAKTQHVAPRPGKSGTTQDKPE